MRITNRIGVAVAVVVVGLGGYWVADVAASTAGEEGGVGVRLGTYDSRAVAVAYYRSKRFRSKIKALKAEAKAAKTAGDGARAKVLEAEGQKLQKLAHNRSFGAWPLGDILEHVRPKLPQIAQEVEVDVVVCRWDIAFQREGVVSVDVTDPMVAAFAPDAKTLEVIATLRKSKPIPLDKLKKHRH